MSDTPPNFPPASDNQPGSAPSSGSGGFPPNEPTGFGAGQASSYNTPPSGGGSGFNPPPPPPPGQSFGQEQYVPPPLTPEPTQNNRTRNILLAVLGGLAALLLCCCIGGLVLTRMGANAAEEQLQELEEEFGTPVPGDTSGDEDVPVTGEDTSVMDLNVGDCFSVADDNDTTVSDTVVTDCSAPHDYEVFHALEHPAGSDDPFPGDEELDSFWDAECNEAFEEYVGMPYDDSVIYMSALEPTESSWEGGDREVLCVLYEENTQLEGSMQGAER